MQKSKLFIMSFITIASFLLAQEDACDLPENTIYLYDPDNGSFQVQYYDSDGNLISRTPAFLASNQQDYTDFIVYTHCGTIFLNIHLPQQRE